MTNEELGEIAVKMVNKGYIDADEIRYCDDLYDATQDEINQCLDYVQEIIDEGINNFKIETNE